MLWILLLRRLNLILIFIALFGAPFAFSQSSSTNQNSSNASQLVNPVTTRPTNAFTPNFNSTAKTSTSSENVSSSNSSSTPLSSMESSSTTESRFTAVTSTSTDNASISNSLSTSMSSMETTPPGSSSTSVAPTSSEDVSSSNSSSTSMSSIEGSSSESGSTAITTGPSAGTMTVSSVMPTPSVTTTASSNMENLGNSTASPAPLIVIVGGAVGGGIVMIITLAICVSLLTIAVLRCNKKSSKEIDGQKGIDFTNTVLENRNSEALHMGGMNPSYEYVDVGPKTSYQNSQNFTRQAEPIESEAIYSAIKMTTKSEVQLHVVPQEYEAVAPTKKDVCPIPLDYEVFVPTNSTPQEPPEYATVKKPKGKSVSGYQTKNNNTKQFQETIYMAPASSVTALYAQLEELMTEDVCRHNISLREMLGSGQFGKVYKGSWKKLNDIKEVAVKTLKEGSSEDDKVKFLQEAAIMGQFKHPHVVTMYGLVTEGEPMMLVLEMLQKGDLRKYLLSIRLSYGRQISSEIDGHELLSYCRQIASGMVYLSNKAFIHRDLAARNILVSDDGMCKISDFGMSRDLEDEKYYISRGGMIPVKWTAPEALCYKKYSTCSDVWSYGVVVHEIWSLGLKPFEGVNNVKVLELLKSGYRLHPPPGCPRAIYKIMMMCWDYEADGRPTFTEITALLSVSNSKLLHWSDEDKMDSSVATTLGGNFISSKKLYNDLQTMYKKKHAKSLNMEYNPQN